MPAGARAAAARMRAAFDEWALRLPEIARIRNSLSARPLVAPPDSQLLHAATERVRIEPEKPRCPARTIDDPIALLEYPENVSTLSFVERRSAGSIVLFGLGVGLRWVLCSCSPLSGFALMDAQELRSQIECGYRRQDQRAIYHVLLLSVLLWHVAIMQPIRQLFVRGVHS